MTTDKPQPQKPKQITLMGCPVCKEPIVTTTDGVYCPRCGYKKIRDK